MVLNFIKPDKTADFETVIGKLKEALQKSDKPERKQQAASWKSLQVARAGRRRRRALRVVIDPSVKDADYTVSTILAEAFPTEVQALYKQYAERTSGQNIINLSLMLDLK